MTLHHYHHHHQWVFGEKPNNVRHITQTHTRKFCHSLSLSLLRIEGQNLKSRICFRTSRCLSTVMNAIGTRVSFSLTWLSWIIRTNETDMLGSFISVTTRWCVTHKWLSHCFSLQSASSCTLWRNQDKQAGRKIYLSFDMQRQERHTFFSGSFTEKRDCLICLSCFLSLQHPNRIGNYLYITVR